MDNDENAYLICSNMIWPKKGNPAAAKDRKSVVAATADAEYGVNASAIY